MAWKDIPDAWLDAESEILDDANNLFDALDDNIDAWRQGLTGAPKLTGAAWADNSFNADRFAALSFTGDLFQDESIGQSSINANAVRQAHIDDTWVEVSLISGSQLVVNPAGEKMLGYESKYLATIAAPQYYRFGFPGLDANLWAGAVSPVGMINVSPEIVSWMWMQTSSGAPPPGMQLRVYWPLSSPPYEIDGRECRLFCYLRQAPDGSVISSWISGTPPWANNGNHRTQADIRLDGKQYQIEPREIPYPDDGSDIAMIRANMVHNRQTKADMDAVTAEHSEAFTEALRLHKTGSLSNSRLREFRKALSLDWRANFNRLYRLHELTPERKNRDLPMIPQPFGPNPRASMVDGGRVVLLEPTDRMADDLAVLHHAGDSVGELIARDYLRIGDELAGAPTPAGIPAVGLKWRATV